MTEQGPPAAPGGTPTGRSPWALAFRRAKSKNAMTSASHTQFIDASAPVRSGEQLDAAKLNDWLTANVPDASGPLTIEQFPQGFSNLTYFLKLGDQELVLRRPPIGNAVRSAHDMGREYHVLEKLSRVYDLAPRPLAYCDDETLLGGPFYVMERRRGVILRKKLPDGFNIAPETFRRLGESLIENLARLHAIDYEAAGLGELGRPAGFIERQVAGWTKRYHQAQTDDFPDVVRTAEWVAANMPAESGATLIHNDYKYDNLVLDPTDLTRITAVLDWEMCTLGDPLLDLGVSLSYWVQADDDEVLRYFIPGPTNLPGNLTRHELIDRYTAITGRDTSNMLFYYAFGMFKLAVIIQQIYVRYAKGYTRDPRFSGLNHVVEGLGRAGMNAIEKGRVP